MICARCHEPMPSGRPCRGCRTQLLCDFCEAALHLCDHCFAVKSLRIRDNALALCERLPCPDPEQVELLMADLAKVRDHARAARLKQ